MTYWTDERVARAKEMWAAGSSASQIARTLGHTTRNAVIGLLHRRGVIRPEQARARQASGPVVQKMMARRERPVAQQKPIKPVTPNIAAEPFRPRVVAIEGQGIGVLALNDNVCRWPLEHSPGGADQLFCGAASETEHSYCAAHARVAFQPQQAKKPRNSNELIRGLRRYL